MRHVRESNAIEGIRTKHGPLYTQHLEAAVAVARDPERYVYDLPAIHRLMLGGQKHPRRIGRTRLTNVWVVGARQRTLARKMPPARDVPELLRHYNQWLRHYLFSELPAPGWVTPYLEGSWINLCIHPFEDGNGRVNRLHLNAMRLALGKPWFVVSKKERGLYYRLIRETEDDFFPQFRKWALKSGA